jgi:hypothetical protein
MGEGRGLALAAELAARGEERDRTEISADAPAKL